METTEALGYLKGLLDGLDLDDNKKETKIFRAIIDVLENLNEDVLDITEEIDAIEEQCDIMSDDLEDLEDVVYSDDFPCAGCDGCDDWDDDDYEEGEYGIVCPNCDEEFIVDEATVEEGSVECPNCGEILSLEVEIEEE